MKKSTVAFWKTFGAEILGSFLISAGIYNFAASSNFPLTGFSGIALILYRLFGLPIGAMTLALNIPVALISYRILGKRFFFRTLRCMLFSSAIIDLLMPLLPCYEGSRMLSAICTGALQGVGYGIIYKNGTSTGGLDFITLSLKAKKPHLSLGVLNFVFDFAIVVGAGALFRDIDGIIYGIIINFIVAYSIDKFMFGANAGKLLMIITEKGKEVISLIDKTIERGSTLVPAKGGYQYADKEIILCACAPKEVYRLMDDLKELDPAVFTIIVDSSEVHGYGFRYTSVGKNE